MFITDTHTGVRLDLDPHQLVGYEFLMDNPRAGLFLEMSLSKTITTLLYLYDMHYREAAISKTLVIAPDKVARLTWPGEIAKWQEVSDLRYSIVAGTAKQRLAALEADAEVYIIGVKNVSWLISQYLRQAISKNTGLPYGPWLGSLPFDCLVIDESSMFKHWTSQRYKDLRRALDKSSVPYRVLLTGTPGELIHLWPQLNILDDGQRLEPTSGRYVDKYFDVRGNGMVIHEYRPKPGAEKAVTAKISDIVLTMQTRDHVELPPLELIDEELELDPYDLEIYKELEREYMLDFEEGSVTVKTPADLVNKLLQVAGGAVYEDQTEGVKVWHELNTLKMDYLEQLVAHYPRENFLIVYQFRHELERIKMRFPFAQELPTGKKLNETFDAWNRGEIKMLILHPASAGHGLNLQFGGRRIVWTSPTFNLEHWLQTNARLLRRGAKRRIFVHRLLVKGTRDMRVRERIKSKDSNQDFIMKEIKRLRHEHIRK